MTDKELRGLSRRELLELLIVQEKEIERLQAELNTAQEKLRGSASQMDDVGSLAEASLAMSSVFDAADAAAKLYLENVASYSERQQAQSDLLITAAEERAKEILAEAEKEKKCKMQAADQYWKQLSGKLEEFYQTHEGLKDFLEARIAKEQEDEPGDSAAEA